MSALDELERSLARAVANGAAADPAAARDAHGEAVEAGRERRGPLARLRPRRGWHVFAALLVAGGLTTGALAATGQFRVVTKGDPNYQVLKLPGYDLAPVSAPAILPMRVEDPRGGPPWALRTFAIGRGQVCAQAGQLYAGQFGVVKDDPEGRTVFQVIPASAGLVGVRCGAKRAGGFSIVAARESQVFGGPGNIPACGGQPTSERCSVSAVQVVRWGFLGPQAETATFVHGDGRRGTSVRPSAESGGAYLFVESVDPAPTRASAELEAALRRKIDERYPRVPYGSIPKADRPAADRKWRERNAYVTEVMRAARSERRAQWTAQLAESIEATFQGGLTRKVAGRGTTGGPLPGVAPLQPAVTQVPRAEVSAVYRGATRAVEVRFRAPVALGARPGNYEVTVRGPVGRRCTDKLESAQATYARETAEGAALVVRVRPLYGAGGPRTPEWCAGRSYTARVSFVSRGARSPRPEVDALVGEASFVAR